MLKKILGLTLSVFIWVGVISPVWAQDPPPQAADYANRVSGISQHSRDIYLWGQSLGNRPNVFSKVGDSLTVSSYFFISMGKGRYNLRDFAYLQPVVAHFSARRARDANSFTNTSLAADNGWTTKDVLDVERRNRRLCRRDESPLVCEYRLVKPSLALILIGTNDVALLSADEYRANLQTIVQISIDRGVIPVLSTLPWRAGYDGQVAAFNGIITDVARTYDVPLWDYASAMEALPNHGISEDGAHPSFPPGDVNTSSDLTWENLAYGYTLRNVMALVVLDLIWRQVMY